MHRLQLSFSLSICFLLLLTYFLITFGFISGSEGKPTHCQNSKLSSVKYIQDTVAATFCFFFCFFSLRVIIIMGGVFVLIINGIFFNLLNQKNTFVCLLSINFNCEINGKIKIPLIVNFLFYFISFPPVSYRPQRSPLKSFFFPFAPHQNSSFFNLRLTTPLNTPQSSILLHFPNPISKSMNYLFHPYLKHFFFFNFPSILIQSCMSVRYQFNNNGNCIMGQQMPTHSHIHSIWHVRGC